MATRDRNLGTGWTAKERVAGGKREMDQRRSHDGQAAGILGEGGKMGEASAGVASLEEHVSMTAHSHAISCSRQLGLQVGTYGTGDAGGSAGEYRAVRGMVQRYFPVLVGTNLFFGRSRCAVYFDESCQYLTYRIHRIPRSRGPVGTTCRSLEPTPEPPIHWMLRSGISRAIEDT